MRWALPPLKSISPRGVRAADASVMASVPEAEALAPVRFVPITVASIVMFLQREKGTGEVAMGMPARKHFAKWSAAAWSDPINCSCTASAHASRNSALNRQTFRPASGDRDEICIIDRTQQQIGLALIGCGGFHVRKILLDGIL